MEEWISNNIFELTTAAIALYAAILTTAQFILNRLDKKPRLRVSTEIAHTFSTARQSQKVIMGTVSNIGNRDVQICGYSLLRGDNQQFVNTSSNCSNPNLPHTLKPGEQLKAWFEYIEVVTQLQSEGIQKMPVQMRFHDGAGKQNSSKKSLELVIKDQQRDE